MSSSGRAIALDLRRILPSKLRWWLRRLELWLLCQLFAAASRLSAAARPPFRVWVGTGSEAVWRTAGLGVLRIEYEAFGMHGFVPSMIRRALRDHSNVVCLIRDQSGRVFGFAWTQLVTKDPATAYLANGAIDRRYRGKGLAGIVLREMEATLRDRGYPYVELDAVLANGWADALTRHYRGRILASRDYVSVHGPKRFLRVSIAETPRRGAREAAVADAAWPGA